MNQTISAAPGWYITYDDDPALSEIVAWKTTTNRTGDQILLPYTEQGPGYPPHLTTEATMQELNIRIVYRPNHDPEETS